MYERLNNIFVWIFGEFVDASIGFSQDVPSILRKPYKCKKYKTYVGW